MPTPVPTSGLTARRTRIVVRDGDSERVSLIVKGSREPSSADKLTTAPIRVVVELTSDEFKRLEKGAAGHNVSDFLRVAGVRVADVRAKRAEPLNEVFMD